MSKAFVKGVNDQFSITQASITFDPFHLMKNMNDAVNKSRIAEQKEQVILKGKKMVVLKNGENLTDRQLERLNELKMSGLYLLFFAHVSYSYGYKKSVPMQQSASDTL